MAKKPNISEAEWKVMELLWASSPQTVSDMVQALSQSSEWKPETIRTLINRLTKKNIIGFEKKGKRHYYVPLLTKDECVKAQTESFLSRAGGHFFKPFLLNFIEEERFSQKEIEQLQDIINKKKRPD